VRDWCTNPTIVLIAVLVFVIPLRNPSTARNWRRCEQLCRQTIASALAQTNPNVRVILACREFEPGMEDPRLIVVRKPFPEPKQDWVDQHRDKYEKICAALVEARKHSPCYVMKLDGDDLVSNRLAAYVHEQANPNGYYIPKGYLWRDGGRTLMPLDNFHVACGSSNIVYANSEELPSSAGVDFSHLPLLRFGHHVTVESYASMGRPLQAIPFRAAIYRQASGENISGFLQPREASRYKKPNWKFYVGLLLEQRKRHLLTAGLKREFFGL